MAPFLFYLLLPVFLLPCVYWKPVESVGRPYPATPLPCPKYCTVDPLTGMCRYPQPVNYCHFIDRIRGRCPSPPPMSENFSPAPSPLPSSITTLSPSPSIAQPPDGFQSPLPTPSELLPPFVLTPSMAPAESPVFGEPQPTFLTPSKSPLTPFTEPETPPPEFSESPFNLAVPDQPPFPTPLEPQPAVMTPSESPQTALTTPTMAPAAPTPEFSELPVDLPIPDQPPFPTPLEPEPPMLTPLLSPAQTPAFSELPVDLPMPPQQPFLMPTLPPTFLTPLQPPEPFLTPLYRVVSRILISIHHQKYELEDAYC